MLVDANILEPPPVVVGGMAFQTVGVARVGVESAGGAAARPGHAEAEAATPATAA